MELGNIFRVLCLCFSKVISTDSVSYPLQYSLPPPHRGLEQEVWHCLGHKGNNHFLELKKSLFKVFEALMNFFDPHTFFGL